jgi:tetratricopeptide (TPR) repeat protein
MLTIKNRLATSTAIVFAVAGLAFFSSGCKPPGARALLEGRRLLAQGKTADAIEQLRTAATLLSTNAHAWNYLGLACHAAGQPAEAAQDYQKALALNPNLVEAHYNLGCLLLEQGNYVAAQNELTAFTMSRPRDINGWLRLGAAQFRGREPAAAEQSYSEALHISPQIPEAWNALGMIQMQRGRAYDASKDFTAAIQFQSDYAPALLNLAIVDQLYLGNRRGALGLYQSYLAVNSAPNKDSVAAVARALDQELNPPPVIVARAVAPPAPAPVYRPEPAPVVQPAPSRPVVRPVVIPPTPTRVVSAPPPNPAPPAPVVVAQNNPPPASEETTPAETSDNPGATPQKNWPNVTPLPPEPTVNNPAVEAPKVVDYPPVAAPVAPAPAPTPQPQPRPKPIARYAYHSPAKPQPGNRALAETPFALGLDEQEAGHLPEAFQAFRAAIGADPAFFKAYYNLAWTAYAMKNWPAALEAYEWALAINPDSSDARYNFALTLKQAGYPIDAVNELQKLLPKRADDAAVHLLLANLYAQQLDAPSLARPQYLIVLQLEPNHPQSTQIRYWLAENPE